MTMKSTLTRGAISLAILTIPLIGNCQQSAPTTSPSTSPNAVLYYPSSQVSVSFEKGGPLFDGKDRNYTVSTGHRDKPGASELHEKDTDVFYVVDGSATFVTGGKMLEGKSTGPNEVRGSGIDGGDTRQLNKGDVIIIPAGVPHWFKDVKSTFNYFVVKVRPQS
jgi:mannose-6-phosphate isomerase-like protein (cupin superfamily)